ncbi:AAA family ATPase [Dactylosporangium roseum]|uniref:AAA family ATPase n=1 Tax=Dactylosporangium roseum TaxID=47989 RepID=A0ABY5Z762_9ACTN|nr:AAA family ATPase [Dactylosporangium roseum]UWZ37898.1 AAA family ATPase [Dactylosporangium roseum]
MTPLSPDQHAAVDRAVHWYTARRRLYFRLEGAAGTGKTSTVRQIADKLAPGSTTYIAPTGKAAAVLRSKGCADAGTIHSAIYAPAGERTQQIRALQAALDATPLWQTTEREKLEQAIAKVRAQPIWTLREPGKAFGGRKPNLLVLDEASMVDDRIFTDLLSFGIPVLALGDPHQLPPVAGHAHWQAGDPDALLTTIHRFGDTAPLIDLATALRNNRPAPRWNGTAGQTRNTWTPADLKDYDQVIVGRNHTRWQIIEHLRDAAGREPGRPEPGDRIMVLRNDPDHNVVNGQQATVIDAFEGDDGDWALTVRTDDGTVLPWPVDGRGFHGQQGQDEAKRDRDSGLIAATFAQAITCHSAQGSQWPRVAVVDEASVFRQAAASWRYTAATRAEKTCLILDPRRMIQRSRQPVRAAA